MKLNEIKTVTQGEYDLSEGVIPVHLTMTLEQVIRDKAVTNSVQVFVMAGLVGMFKDGGPSRWPRDLNSYPMATTSESIDEIKALNPADQTGLAIWLCNALNSPASFESNQYTRPQMTGNDWVRYVLQKQD